MRIAIGIATRGRAAILAEVLAELRRQTRAPDRIIVCHVTPEDVGARAPGSNTLSPRPGCRASATPSSTRPPIATRCCSSTTTSWRRPGIWR
ncbi:glycosyltransferase family 2 protein [Siccirubricoccus deserti]